MRFVFSTIGTLGDVLPFVQVAAELHNRGHETTLLVNPAFQALVESHGIGFEPLGTAEEYSRVAQSEDFYHPLRGVKAISSRWIVPGIRETLKYLERFRDARETVLVGSAVTIGLRMAQEMYGLPLHTLVLSPFFLPSVYVTPIPPGFALPQWAPRPLKKAMQSAADSMLDRLLKPEINAIRSERNLKALDSAVRSWWFSPQSVIALFPAWFAAAQPDWPDAVTLTNFLPPPASDGISADLQRFLDQPGPLVVVTMGSILTGNRELLASIGRAAAESACKWLLLTPAPGVVEAFPAGRVMQVPFAPLRSVLPHTNLVIHHAGIGTASAAIWSGVPQLLMPYGHDQFDNAARLKHLGVASVLSAGTRRHPSRLLAEFNRMLSDAGVHAACRNAQQLFFSSPGVDRLCALLEGSGSASALSHGTAAANAEAASPEHPPTSPRRE